MNVLSSVPIPGSQVSCFSQPIAHSICQSQGSGTVSRKNSHVYYAAKFIRCTFALGTWYGIRTYLSVAVVSGALISSIASRSLMPFSDCWSNRSILNPCLTQSSFTRLISSYLATRPFSAMWLKVSCDSCRQSATERTRNIGTNQPAVQVCFVLDFMLFAVLTFFLWTHHEFCSTTGRVSP